SIPIYFSTEKSISFIQKKSPFWQFADIWHINPVKGILAKKWNYQNCQLAINNLLWLKKNYLNSGKIIVTPLDGGFDKEIFSNISKSFYTKTVTSTNLCQAHYKMLHIDTSGDVLPCNSILWETKNFVKYGNINSEKICYILKKRNTRIYKNEIIYKAACQACDSINIIRNKRMTSSDKLSCLYPNSNIDLVL
ncbi:hypothetical protein MHK_002033, partial [Candidatus Magnetomorum sp. HK-1]